ncbi:MAG: efflux RND transporter periplasmic adaptor subunit [Bacteroidales bacterium]|nr:efflux RND transporter periplasmic adaptor subunit [Bacteroidales bacterium]MBN2749291.1 efflux RND transporter periplasmic adaptor subunit [Bacteroidales bacterium]
MKKILALSIAVILVSCGGNPEEQIKARLAELKEKSIAIDHEIKTLEDELALLKSGEGESGKIPVYVERLQYQLFEHFVIVNGAVEPVEEAKISPEVGGQIVKVAVKKGDRVSAGQLLVELNTSVTERGIQEVNTALELATKVYDKQKALYDQSVGSEIQYLEAKNAKESLERKLATLKAQLAMAVIKAPFTGIVDEVYVKEGELGAPGAPLLHLVSLKRMKVKANLAENYLSKIAEGDVVKLSFPTFPDILLSVPIKQIGNVVDYKSRTVPIELEFSNGNESIKANQIALLNLKDFEEAKAIVVPSLVIKQDSKGEFLFITSKDEAGETVAKKVYVKTGLSFRERTLIKSGLAVGDQIIVSGFNLVGNGSKVTIK